MNKKVNEVQCANCRELFLWDEAYKCQGDEPPGRAFCPHCGALIIEWNNALDSWEWIEENEGLNTDETVEETKKVLTDSQLCKKMVEHNYEIATAHFSYAVLQQKLRPLILDCIH